MNIKKVNFQVPGYISQLIQEDQKRFHLNNNQLCNRIFKMLKLSKQSIPTTLEAQGKIQFNLHQSNQEDFEALIGHEIGSEISKSEYFRNIFALYGAMSTEAREQLLFCEIYQKLKKMIQKKIAIKLKYRNDKKYHKLEPYFLAIDPSTRFNYLCGWGDQHQHCINYRLSFIEKIFPLEREVIHTTHGIDIVALQKHFDPYLSYGKKVTVRLTEHGVYLLGKYLHNRPKLLKQEGDRYTFEASELKGQLFFAGFWEDAEIIEPRSLRVWFKERSKRLVTLYED